MKLSLIENGLDSLHSGYKALNKYYSLLVSHGDDDSKSIKLKRAIIDTHHGIEILMKYILSSHNELLIFSNIDNNVKNAYKEKHQKNLSSIFESSNIDKVHTVTFSEAFERLNTICNHTFSDDFKEKIDLLEKYRNRLTHAEISIDDQDIILLFDNLLDELDMYLFSNIGVAYKTLSGYSELIKNHDVYKDWLTKNHMDLKASVLSTLTSIFQTLSINMGVNEVKRITDVNVCQKLFENLFSEGFKLGCDFYNGTCSGDIGYIKRISDKHFSLYARDNNGEEIFSFRSLIIYNPQFSSDFSPIFILESNQDDELSNIELANRREEYCKKGKYVIDGLRISTETEVIYDPEKLNELLFEIDNATPSYTYHHITKYVSKTILCMINIQGLDYGRFDRLVSNYYECDGEELTIRLRESLNKRKVVL